LTSAGGLDILVAKYDGSGNVLWAKRFGGSLNDYGRSIVIDKAGNIFIVGEFFSSSITFGAASLSNASSTGKSDIFIVKFDPNGNVIWARKAGGIDDDVTQSAALDQTGNVLITGRFKGSATFGTSTTLASAGDFDIFVARYRTNGNLHWARKAGGTGLDRGFDIAADKDVLGDGDDNNIYVTGDFSGTADFNPTPGAFRVTSAGNTDVFVVKYDSLGNVKWVASAGGISSDRGLGIGVGGLRGNDDYVIVTGIFSGVATFGPTTSGSNMTLTSAGDEDIFIANYSARISSGQLRKVVQSGGTSKEFVTNITVDDNATSFITGFFQRRFHESQRSRQPDLDKHGQ
jgi:hypothetical protein